MVELVVDGADDPDVGGAPEPVDPGPGGGAAARDVEEEPRLEAPGRPPRVRLADFVWKLSTPTSPAAVAAMTMGARLIEGILSSVHIGSEPPGLERKRFFVDPAAGHSEFQRGGDHALAEAIGPTDIDITGRELRNQSSQGAGIEANLVARADDLVELTTTLLDEGGHFVAVDELVGGRGPDDDGHVDRGRQVLEEGTQWGDADPGPDQHDAI